jgi:general secretion pathway protein J
MNSASPQLRTRDREHGFTLIELIVSLTILAVILMLLGAGLRVLAKNSDANAERIETLDMLSRAFDILHRDAAGLQRLVDGDGQRPRFLFMGASDELYFVTLEPPYPSEAGPYFVSYSVVANGPDRELIRARAPYKAGMHAFPGATPANRVSLLRGPYKYELAYAQTVAGKAMWRSSWPDRSSLPALIRLEIIDARGGQPIAAPMIVAIRADAELSCLGGKSTLCSAKTGGALVARTEDAGSPGAERRNHE